MKSHILFSITLNLILISSIFGQDTAKSSRFEPDYTWKADLDHSFISFQTKHWEIVDIIGWFEDYDVTLKKDGDNWETSKIKIVINPKSVRMPNMGMAENLQKEEYLDSDNFPEIIFISKNVERLSDSNYVVKGDFTIRSVSRPINWEVKFNGATNPPYGTPGFTATGTFLLSDFKIKDMEKPPNDDKFIVGDSVYVRCSFRLDAEWD